MVEEAPELAPKEPTAALPVLLELDGLVRVLAISRQAVGLPVEPHLLWVDVAEELPAGQQLVASEVGRRKQHFAVLLQLSVELKVLAPKGLQARPEVPGLCYKRKVKDNVIDTYSNRLPSLQSPPTVCHTRKTV